MRPPPGGMMPDLAQPAGLTDQERMANLIRQCMAPLPTVKLFSVNALEGLQGFGHMLLRLEKSSHLPSWIVAIS